MWLPGPGFPGGGGPWDTTVPTSEGHPPQGDATATSLVPSAGGDGAWSPKGLASERSQASPGSQGRTSAINYKGARDWTVETSHTTRDKQAGLHAQSAACWSCVCPRRHPVRGALISERVFVEETGLQGSDTDLPTRLSKAPSPS